MTCGIYKLTSPNNKAYIGQSINIEKRFSEHKRRANKKSIKHSFKLYNSIRKYGWDNFTKEIIHVCNAEELNDKEVYYIDLYNSIDQGLNGRSGGDSGWKVTQQTKDKLRYMNLGKYNGDQNIEFYVDGYLYKSIGSASKILGIANKTIHNRLNSSNAKYASYLYKNESLIPVRKIRTSIRKRKILIDGILFQSIAEAIKLTGIKRSTIFYRLKSGVYTYTN